MARQYIANKYTCTINKEKNYSKIEMLPHNKLHKCLTQIYAKQNMN